MFRLSQVRSGCNLTVKCTGRIIGYTIGILVLNKSMSGFPSNEMFVQQHVPSHKKKDCMINEMPNFSSLHKFWLAG